MGGASMAQLIRLDDEAIHDWYYYEFLNENPGIKRAVEAGKITKENVMAGMKARAEEIGR